MSPTSDLEARVARLEAIEAIRNLKARYWYACDRKDVEGVRDCFADGPVVIDYDGPAGVLAHRDALYELFERTSCKPNMVEIHHGGPGQIELLDDTHARAVWGLVYQLTDTATKLQSFAGGYYEDEYAFREGRWWITSARFRVVSSTLTGFRDGMSKVLHASANLPG